MPRTSRQEKRQIAYDVILALIDNNTYDFEQVPKHETKIEQIAVEISQPNDICCEVVRDSCEIQHSREPQQQEVHKYKEVCDVPDDAIVNRSEVLTDDSNDTSVEESVEESVDESVDESVNESVEDAAVNFVL